MLKFFWQNFKVEVEKNAKMECTTFERPEEVFDNFWNECSKYIANPK